MMSDGNNSAKRKIWGDGRTSAWKVWTRLTNTASGEAIAPSMPAPESLLCFWCIFGPIVVSFCYKISSVFLVYQYLQKTKKKSNRKFFYDLVFYTQTCKIDFFLFIRSICFWWKFILAFSDCKMLIFLFLNVLAKQELKSLFTRISTVVLHVVLFYKIWRSWADLQPTIKLLFHYCHALTLLWALFSSCYTFLLLMFWWMVSNTWSLRVATHRMLKATPSHTQSGKQGPGPVLYTTRLCDIYVICL